MTKKSVEDAIPLRFSIDLALTCFKPLKNILEPLACLISVLREENPRPSNSFAIISSISALTESYNDSFVSLKKQQFFFLSIRHFKTPLIVC